MLGDFDQPLRKIEGLAPLHPDRHCRAQARAAMAAGAGFVLDDPIGARRSDAGSRLCGPRPAPRPALLFAKAHWRARLPQTVARRRLRTRRTVQSEPAPEFGVCLRLPTHAEARRSAPQCPAGESSRKGITNFQASLLNRRPQPHFPTHCDLSDLPGWAVTVHHSKLARQTAAQLSRYRRTDWRDDDPNRLDGSMRTRHQSLSQRDRRIGRANERPQYPAPAFPRRIGPIRSPPAIQSIRAVDFLTSPKRSPTPDLWLRPLATESFG